MKPRSGKPPVGTRLPVDGAASAGLLYAWLMQEGAGNTTRELLKTTAVSAAFTGLVLWEPAKDGSGLHLYSSSSSLIGFGSKPTVAGLAKFTYWLRFKMVAMPASGTVAAFHAENVNFGTIQRFGAWVDNAHVGPVNSLIVNYSPVEAGPMKSVQTGANTIVAGKWYDLIFVYDSVGGTVRAYLNGVLAANDTVAVAISATTGFSINFGSPGTVIYGTSGVYPDVVVEGFAFWNRAFSPNEVPAFSQNPYKAFAWPQRRTTGFVASTAYTISLTESVTPLVLVGKKPSLPFSEAATLAAVLAKQARKVVVNSVATNDALTRFTARKLLETAAATDSRANLIRRLLAQSVTADDSVALHITVKSILLAEAVMLFDARRALTRRAMAEVITTTDTALASHLFVKTLAEAATLADTKALRASRKLAEAVVANDTFAIRRIFARTLAETITAAASIVRRSSKSLPEAITAIDTLRRLLSRAMLEMSVLAASVKKQTQLVMDEDVTPTDSFLAHKIVNTFFVETVLALDALAKRTNAGLSDAIDASDSLHFAMAREFVEAVMATDLYGNGQFVSFVEAVTLIDAVFCAIVPNPSQVVESVWGREPQQLVWNRFPGQLIFPN